jgi:hypothetical protein
MLRGRNEHPDRRVRGKGVEQAALRAAEQAGADGFEEVLVVELCVDLVYIGTNRTFNSPKEGERAPPSSRYESAWQTTIP